MTVATDVVLVVVDFVVSVVDGGNSFGSVHITMPRTCFSLRAPQIRMFQMVKFEGPSRVGHTDVVGTFIDILGYFLLGSSGAGSGLPERGT